MRSKMFLLTINFILINIASAQINNLRIADPLSETALYPVPKEMSFEEYQDMNRRISQALLWSSIPIPGITHYYAGDFKTAKRLFFLGAGGFACLMAGIISLEDAKWPSDRENYFIQNPNQENERWYERIPHSLDITATGEEIIHYELKEIQKESSGGGILIFTGLAIILGDFAYDRIVGLRLIEQKRDKVRYKYGQKLDFSFHKGFLPYKQQIGFKLNFNFG